MESVPSIREELSRDIIADLYLSASIDRVSERMDKNLVDLHNMTSGLYDISVLYRRKEEEPAAHVGL